MDCTQNIISLCTGYGGIELGIKRTGLPVRTVAYVEIEAFAIANLVAKIEAGQMDAAPIWSNLKTFDGRPFRGKVHGIIGGYPCQPFSNAGKRQGAEDPRHLWPYIEKHIRTIRPVWCFFENVGGHLTLGFEEVAQGLRDLGYKVEAGLFTAAEVGGRHLRERLFILAYSDSNGLEKDANYPILCPQADNKRNSRHIKSVRWPNIFQESPASQEVLSGPTSVVGVDGPKSWVDELRLLGNGVNPDTAELAFRTLWNRSGENQCQ